MNVRMSTTETWPNPSEVFALTVGGAHIPLLLIAIMTMVLITSSGTMAMAVNFGYRRNRKRTAPLMFATAALGMSFVGMQAFEWTKLIVEEGVRPWGNPMGAAQFGSSFFMITGFHGLHVSGGVIYLQRGCVARAERLLRSQRHVRDGRNRRPVLALRRPGVGVHLRVLLFVVGVRHGSRYTGDAQRTTPCQRTAKAQQHPIRIYLWIWGLLFVFSAFSYMVDYFQLQGPLRWTLILLFMFLKAGFIVAIFMHMAWERLALKLAILVPPLTLLVLIDADGDRRRLHVPDATRVVRASEVGQNDQHLHSGRKSCKPIMIAAPPMSACSAAS